MSGLQPIEEAAAAQVMRQARLFGWTATEGAEPEADLVSLSRQGSSGVIYALDVAIDVLAGGRVRFTPVLGLVHLETGLLVSSFLGRAPVDESLPTTTIGCSLADLIRSQGQGTFERWIASSPAEVDRLVGVVFSDVVEFGLPFLRSFASLQDVIEWLKRAKPYQELKANLAVASMLDNRRLDAIQALADYVSYTATQSPPIVDRSWRFVNAYIEHFGLDNSVLPFRVIRSG